jgi:hypothetical protein
VKDRAIDLALVVGLVLVAGAIVWTLFSLGGGRGGPPPDRGGGIVAPDGGGGGGVVPIAPDGSGGDASAGGGAAGAGVAADGASDGAAPSGDAADDGATTADGGAAATDGADGSDGSDAGDAGAVPAGPSPDRPDPTVPAAQAPPVPEDGPAELGRIGFSFVTGGAGACGIVLEPWTHVAVSRELLAAYGCGAEVTVALDDPKDGRTTVTAVVGDTMNEAFSRTVNIYVAQDEPALAYGLTAGTIAPR